MPVQKEIISDKNETGKSNYHKIKMLNQISRTSHTGIRHISH